MNALFIRIAPFLFKPSLEHENRSIRLLAVERLDFDDPQQQDYFINWLQQEDDARLMLEALPRFPDRSRLIQLLNSLQDDSHLSRTLSQFLAGQLSAPDAADQPLLSSIRHPSLLLELIRSAETLELRLQLLEQLDAEEHHWLEIALSNSLARVRQQAAERITSESALEKLMREAQGDKRVQRLARERLAALRAAQQAAAEAETQRNQLLEQLARLTEGRDDQLFAARLEHLQQQWQNLQQDASVQQQQHFARLNQQAETRAEQLRQEEQQRLQQLQAQQAARNSQLQLLEQLQQLEQQLLNKPQGEQQPLSSNELQQQLHHLQQSWQAAYAVIKAEAQTQKHFQQLHQQLSECCNALTQWQNLQPALQQLLDAEQPDIKSLQQLLASLRWPATLDTPELLQQARRCLKQTQTTSSPQTTPRTQPDTRQLQQELERLEQLLDEGNSRQAVKLHQQLQALADSLPTHHALVNRFKSLTARVAELRDWQGFVAAPKRETLCEQMEALAADQDMAPQAKADRIQALQQEWRELGSAAASKALWGRFKQAADLAYEPCRTWFAEQSQVREHNQQQRGIICDELEQLASSNSHLNLDETALDQLLTGIHDEWHRFSPVNRVEGKRLADRFQQALTPLRDQLHQLRQQHAEHKRELIRQAEALLTTEDLQAAIEQSKQLQQQWREIGSAPGSLEHQLWKSFRSHCDALFQLRDEQRRNQQQQRNQRFTTALEQLAAAREAMQQGQLQEARRLFRQAAGLRQVPKREQNSWEAELTAFAMELDQLQLAEQRQASSAELQALLAQLPEQGEPEDQQAAQRLLLQLDLLTGYPIAAEEQAAKLQLQVELMNAGLGQQQDHNPHQQICQLIQHWQQLGGSRSGAGGTRLQQSVAHYCSH
ncbi:DUF349 domain-containing protein [Marinospirillum alkaliphilum]|uniref:DUF349 domain-containing protein n=1 Tax=Marinospirillum alkaliphilum DSM 21637 TaxID=1122209 RepID=A0A1K1ZTY6_9GAMM|nr:DUF349 domain-containing protein [Marinospirillum alkaliphilum]SFX77607.1 protein of unknown function [Marinospirillum alkaliphilum DSM 21637]